MVLWELLKVVHDYRWQGGASKETIRQNRTNFNPLWTLDCDILSPVTPWADAMRKMKSVGEIKLCTKRIAMRLVSQGDLHVVHLQPCCSEHKADRLTLGGSVWTLYGPQFYGAVSKSFICTAFCGAGTFLICTLLFLHLSWWFDFFFVRFFFFR